MAPELLAVLIAPARVAVSRHPGFVDLFHITCGRDATTRARTLITVPLAVIALGSFLTGDVGAHSVKGSNPGPTDRPRSELSAARETSSLRGVPCSLTPVPAAGEPTPVGAGPCPGTRPGGRVLSAVGDCTLNFLFRGPDGTRYIGTAGHCVDAGDEYTFDKHGNARFERVWARGTGPVAMDPTGRRFGEFAYVVKHDPKDFALIRLDPEVPASPEMCHFGAPTAFSPPTPNAPSPCTTTATGKASAT